MIRLGEVLLTTVLDVVREGRSVTVAAVRCTTTRDADSGEMLDLTPAELDVLETRFVVAERIERDQIAAARARTS